LVVVVLGDGIVCGECGSVTGADDTDIFVPFLTFSSWHWFFQILPSPLAVRARL
jgi:hypothetical protein